MLAEGPGDEQIGTTRAWEKHKSQMQRKPKL